MKICNGTIGIAIKRHKRIHKIPHGFVVGVEDMCTVFVHMNAVNILTVGVAANMRALVNNQTVPTRLFGQIGKGGSEQPSPNDNIVVLFQTSNLNYPT